MPYRFAGYLIDLGRRQAHLKHFVNGDHHSERADTIGDEIRTILRWNNSFTEPLIEKAGNFARDLAAGLRARNDLDQLHIPRRVEEMNSEKMLLEIVGEGLDDRCNRQAARVRRDDRAWFAIIFHLCKELVFDVKIFYDSLYQQIAIIQLLDFVDKIAGPDELRVAGEHERSRL